MISTDEQSLLCRPLTTPEIVDVIKAASPDSAAIVQTAVQEGQTDETGGAGGASDGALPGYAKVRPPPPPLPSHHIIHT